MTAPLLTALRQAVKLRAVTPTNQPGSDNAKFGGTTYYRQADADAARDDQTRAEKLDRQWAPAMRAAGWWLS